MQFLGQKTSRMINQKHSYFRVAGWCKGGNWCPLQVGTCKHCRVGAQTRGLVSPTGWFLQVL
jgi:hypothetical protein